MPAAKTLNRYRLIGGTHIAEDVTAEPLKDEAGKPLVHANGPKKGEPKYPVIHFNADQNNIVVSADDLTKKHVNKFVFAGPYGGRAAFKEPGAVPSHEVGATGKPASKFVAAELEAMTVPDLKELAAEEEIDLRDAHLKADIVKAILAAK